MRQRLVALFLLGFFLSVKTASASVPVSFKVNINAFECATDAPNRLLDTMSFSVDPSDDFTAAVHDVTVSTQGSSNFKIDMKVIDKDSTKKLQMAVQYFYYSENIDALLETEYGETAQVTIGRCSKQSDNKELLLVIDILKQ